MMLSGPKSPCWDASSRYFQTCKLKKRFLLAFFLNIVQPWGMSKDLNVWFRSCKWRTPVSRYFQFDSTQSLHWHCLENLALWLKHQTLQLDNVPPPGHPTLSAAALQTVWVLPWVLSGLHLCSAIYEQLWQLCHATELVTSGHSVNWDS